MCTFYVLFLFICAFIFVHFDFDMQNCVCMVCWNVWRHQEIPIGQAFGMNPYTLSTTGCGTGDETLAKTTHKRSCERERARDREWEREKERRTAPHFEHLKLKYTPSEEETERMKKATAAATTIVVRYIDAIASYSHSNTLKSIWFCDP